MLMLTTPYRIQQRTPHNRLHQTTLLYRTLCQCVCLPPHTKHNNEHPTIACTNKNCYIEHLTKTYAYHHIPNSTTNTSQPLAPIDTAISNTLPMLMLTSTYQIQERTPYNCLHQCKLLQQTPHQCLCLPPHTKFNKHTKFNNEHPTAACAN